MLGTAELGDGGRVGLVERTEADIETRLDRMISRAWGFSSPFVIHLANIY